MERGKQIIGMLLILVSIGALVTWEKWGKNRFLYDEVLVLNQNVEKGTVITEAMLEKKHMDVSERDCIKAEELQTAIGREAAFFIHKNVPLFSAYFLPEGLTPDESRGRYILSIPSHWLAAAPRVPVKGRQGVFLLRRQAGHIGADSSDGSGKRLHRGGSQRQAGGGAVVSGRRGGKAGHHLQLRKGGAYEKYHRFLWR